MDFSSLGFNGSNTLQHLTGGNWHHTIGFSKDTVSQTTFVLKESNLISPKPVSFIQYMFTVKLFLPLSTAQLSETAIKGLPPQSTISLICKTAHLFTEMSTEHLLDHCLSGSFYQKKKVRFLTKKINKKKNAGCWLCNIKEVCRIKPS